METSTLWNRITEKEPKKENKKDEAAKRINKKQRTPVFQEFTCQLSYSHDLTLWKGHLNLSRAHNIVKNWDNLKVKLE